MPYDNAYNRSVANHVNLINKKYVAHSDMTGQGTVDYNQAVNIGEGLSGGANPNSMMGSGYSGGVAEYHKGPTASKKGGNEPMEPCSCEDMEGGAILGFQEGTLINPKKRESKDKSEPAVSVGVLGLPELKAPKPVARLPKIPAAGKVIGNAVKSNSTIEGGGGFAAGTHMDTGEGEKTLGAVGSGKKVKLTKPEMKLINMVKNKEQQGKKLTKAEKVRLMKLVQKDKMVGGGLLGSLGIPIVSNIAGMLGLGKHEKMEGNGFLSSLGIPVVSNIAGMLGLGKEEKKMEGNGFLSSLGIPVVSGIAGMLGLGKVDKNFMLKMEAKHKQGKKPTKAEFMRIEKMKGSGKLQGAGWWDDFTSGVKKGFMSVVGPVASIAKPILSVIPDPRAQAASVGLSVLGLGKNKKAMKGGMKSASAVETVKSTPKMVQSKVVPKAQMPGSSMSGFGKPKSKRAEIVKKIMKEKNMSMIEASKYVKQNNLY
jgi:hypothetical protein